MTDEQAIEILEEVKELDDSMFQFNSIYMEALDYVIQKMKSCEQMVIRCKDCNEWHRGKTHNGLDVHSEEGYCSVQRLITGENYYCGDAERSRIQNADSTN